MLNGYKKIFWGMFFTAFHINLGSIQFLPNFIAILIVSSGIREILIDNENASLNLSLKLNNISAFVSFIIFILPFLGIDTSSNNIVLTEICFNVVSILEIIVIVKLLEGTSQILSEKYSDSLGKEYRNKAIKYLWLYPVVIIVINFNFIFMSEMIELVLGIYALIIKLWIMLSFRRLYKREL
ncbi:MULTISPECIES: hypothetical protein [unclassified Clostridium]|uniref:hypothetical protein n=1 Tax=unclassified Clostridium TaxID=2614128 RepID=UPI00189A1C91|nr:MULTISPECIES: hypothetical protein [unclassified Clostridium]